MTKDEAYEYYEEILLEASQAFEVKKVEAKEWLKKKLATIKAETE